MTERIRILTEDEAAICEVAAQWIRCIMQDPECLKDIGGANAKRIAESLMEISRKFEE